MICWRWLTLGVELGCWANAAEIASERMIASLRNLRITITSLEFITPF